MKSGINIRKVLNKLNELDFNIAKDRHAFGELYETILKNLQSAGKSGEFYTPRAITQFLTEMIDPQIGEKVLDPASGTGGFLTGVIEHLRKDNTSIETLKQIQDNVIGWEYKPLPFLLATTNLILHDVEVPNITFRDALDQPLTNYTEKDRVDVILANPPFGGIVANNNETNFPQNFRTKESADLFLILMIHLLKMGGRAGIVLPDGSLTGEGVKQRVRERLLTECNLHTIIRLAEQRFSALCDGCDESFVFHQRNADARNLVLRTPSARRSKELQQNKNDSPGRISADQRLVEQPDGKRNLLGKFTSKRSNSAATIWTSKTRTSKKKNTNTQAKKLSDYSKRVLRQ